MRGCLRVRQPYPYTLKVDTLSLHHDSAWVNIRHYKNGNLIEEGTAFLRPDTYSVSRRWVGKRTMYVERVIRHGQTNEYLCDSQRAVTHYDMGIKRETSYYDCTGAFIPRLQTNDLTIGPCGIVTGEFLFSRESFQKRRKRKK